MSARRPRSVRLAPVERQQADRAAGHVFRGRGKRRPSMESAGLVAEIVADPGIDPIRMPSC
eukprot:5063005-Lingulodinium_polyedra.AAC.1